MKVVCAAAGEENFFLKNGVVSANDGDQSQSSSEHSFNSMNVNPSTAIKRRLFLKMRNNHTTKRERCQHCFYDKSAECI